MQKQWLLRSSRCSGEQSSELPAELMVLPAELMVLPAELMVLHAEAVLLPAELMVLPAEAVLLQKKLNQTNCYLHEKIFQFLIFNLQFLTPKPP